MEDGHFQRRISVSSYMFHLATFVEGEILTCHSCVKYEGTFDTLTIVH